MADSQLDVIRHALQVARERGFTEVELEFGDTEFQAKLGSVPAPQPAATAVTTAVVAAPASDDGLKAITAPVVGYLKESGKALEVGQRVEKGQVVAVVAALGLANDVESAIAGEVVEVLVRPGEPVEYGQAVAKVRVS